jgi:hypothetical protein
MMQKGAFWALNKGIAFDSSKKTSEKAKAVEYFQAAAVLYEKVMNSTNPPFPAKESWAAASFKNLGIVYGRMQHVPENSVKMALAFETYLARSEPQVDPVDQRFEMHRWIDNDAVVAITLCCCALFASCRQAALFAGSSQVIARRLVTALADLLRSKIW